MYVSGADRCGAEGFSLIEVLIAFMLVSVAVMSLMSWLLFIEQRSDYALRSSEAISVAERKLAWFATRGASNELSALPVADFELDVVSGEEVVAPDYTLRWNVQRLSASLKSVRIEVIWQDRLDNTRSIEITTMLSGVSQFQP